MPVMLIPQKGEKYVFRSGDFVFFHSVPSQEGISILFLKSDIVCGFGTEWVRGWIRTTPYLFSLLCKEGSQLFLLPNWILLLLKNDPSKDISQTSEIWDSCLESMRLMVSRWRDQKKRRWGNRGRRAEDKRQGEAWTLDHSACEPGQASHLFCKSAIWERARPKETQQLCTSSWDCSSDY